ncbi:2-C-methyl-D-erythritol 2,4-cyclodiphosphate synthase [Serratia fonticola]|uniref:2-C-methyl-D-erythritol 2,4-cyclodiphosphate synthase n=1 Tax=Serratia fonticola TaxID=47917 RepID=A0A448S8L2_SERFO|nr:2-C-methyl-D-erythritol 2,4-cyclodiphosphate synthase [Serratia fonticola]
MRIGHGFDVHKFGGEGPLVIGGVRIPYEKGLLAHSDGDVALHAATDALLGAAALGDIGKLFPDTDPAFKGRTAANYCVKPGNAFVPRAIVWVIWMSPSLRRHRRWHRTFLRCASSWRKICNAIWTTLTSKRPPPNSWALPAVAKALPAKRLPC